ncbi:Inhibitor of g-type lysozyme precursor [Roseivivax jejudonensis]|uniref:Inhibitor of g-type lysozyme n=1 Tax=Roseivivax jejudonensis TaxID=1529041 RepID=A0A1X6Y3P1_9RHOB|nr:Inhibitor of g-type lysozyme precursor [Roseivivax jejudonensis]
MRFDPGATSATINGTIRGDEYRDYVVTAQAGQAMVVSLAVTGTNGHGSAFFNILPAGLDYDGLYVGSTDVDSRAEVTIPRDGDWAIRVYLMGNDRDADRTVGYSIDVFIAPNGAGASQAARTGGTATVVGVASNDVLNVRSGPGTTFGIIGALATGDPVRRLGCQDASGSRWCEIEMMTDMRERGWVSARYLSDGGTQVNQTSRAPRTERVRFEPGTNGTEFTDQLGPGMSVTYQFGASDEQEMYFRLAADTPALSWRLYTPDGALLDQATSAREYRGSLFQSGDHRIEVTNADSAMHSFNVILGIQ